MRDEGTPRQRGTQHRISPPSDDSSYDWVAATAQSWQNVACSIYEMAGEVTCICDEDGRRREETHVRQNLTEPRGRNLLDKTMRSPPRSRRHWTKKQLTDFKGRYMLDSPDDLAAVAEEKESGSSRAAAAMWRCPQNATYYYYDGFIQTIRFCLIHHQIDDETDSVTFDNFLWGCSGCGTN
jgi:hypothetical protein